jgi:hypothetical protein
MLTPTVSGLLAVVGERELNIDTAHVLAVDGNGHTDSGTFGSDADGCVSVACVYIRQRRLRT